MIVGVQAEREHEEGGDERVIGGTATRRSFLLRPSALTFSSLKGGFTGEKLAFLRLSLSLSGIALTFTWKSN